MPPNPRPRPRPHRTTGAQRLAGLLTAQRAITADLSLASILDRIVQTACELVGARYGAVGVLGPDRSIEQFVHFGLDAETVAAIGHLPTGHGLLGAVLDVPSPVRLADLTVDERARGFPAAHPVMRSFLGVPIRARGAAFGELYLADPRVGWFDADDEELVTALAAAAGSAIDNARLYEQARRSRDWLNASGEIARVLLADGDDDEVLFEVVARALEVAEADYAALILPTDKGELEVTVALGLGASDWRGHIFDPGASELGRAIVLGQSYRIADLEDGGSPSFVNRFGYGAAMVVPLVDAQGVRGAVLVVRRIGRLAFTADDAETARTFGAQVALALQLSDARADAEALRLLEGRHQFAQSLHDNVMQRLFATGVGLQVLADQQLDLQVAARLQRHITDLDDTIEEIRTRVFGLEQDDPTAQRHHRARGARIRPSASVPSEAVDVVS